MTNLETINRNIDRMVYRIQSEAETMEDMGKLVVSEIGAFLKFVDKLSYTNCKIYLFTESEIKGNVAVVGQIFIEGQGNFHIELHQKMLKNGILKSTYEVPTLDM